MATKSTSAPKAGDSVRCTYLESPNCLRTEAPARVLKVAEEGLELEVERPEKKGKLRLYRVQALDPKSPDLLPAWSWPEDEAEAKPKK